MGAESCAPRIYISAHKIQNFKISNISYYPILITSKHTEYKNIDRFHHSQPYEFDNSYFQILRLPVEVLIAHYSSRALTKGTGSKRDYNSAMDISDGEVRITHSSVLIFLSGTVLCFCIYRARRGLLGFIKAEVQLYDGSQG